jgi:hypothetical protein
MTVLDDVAALVQRFAPNAICDDCITSKLSLTVRQHANIKTRELAKSGSFRREKGECHACKQSKLVIRHA